MIVDGTAYFYDYLLLAAGATHAYFGHDEWVHSAPGLKTLEDALAMRARILMAFERAEAARDPAVQAAWLSFVIVGGGPTGVKLAGTLAEIARHTLKQEFHHINPAAAQVLLVEAGPRVLPTFPASLSTSARRHLERLGLTVKTGSEVTQIDALGIQLEGRRIEARTVLWAAGVAGSPLGRTFGSAVDAAGRVLVESDLSVSGHPEVFVAGDLASFTQNGQRVPGIATAAKQMGRHAGRTLRARLVHRPAGIFRYRDYGVLATIGRMAAVADLGRVRLRGLLGWWFWLFVHIFFLIGFRNRLTVLIDWASAYWTYRRNARIIIGRAW